ncbi:MAG: membrane protein insertion efficiency factor YidD [bacterium]|nr:membrane protein insertion efficiency factor YidD [bacterium]
MVKICIILIKIYQLFRQFFPKRCCFYPSCSEYAIQSFKKEGFLRGLVKTIKRILKCHPFSGGGIDFP